jgi:Ser/Thr protein kinase RdoA (MazF antagonist)
MMTLRLMQAVVATLNEQDESPIADLIAQLWAPDPSNVRYFRASANFIFTFTLNEQPAILRFAHESERAAAAIEAELAFLRRLAARHVPVALPIRSLSGRYVESVATSLGIFHAVVFERLSGEHHDIDDLSLDQYTQWGNALGVLHQAAEGYSGIGRPTVYDHVRRLEQQLPEHEQAARRLLGRLKPQIAALPADEHSFGLIHYDFELDNLLWNKQISVIDFDDCACYWFVADIAFALRDLFDDHAGHINMMDARFQAFVHGYRTVRAMTDEELRRLPLLLQLHHLMTFTKLLRAIDVDDTSAAPAWVVDLRARLLRKAQSYRDGFASTEA